MVVMILEKVPTSLRGSLSRWLIEPKSGFFVGKISALVRDKLWEMCIKRRGATGVIQIWTASNEQGFDLRAFGQTTKQLIDAEGLWIVRKPRTNNLDPNEVICNNDGTDTCQPF